jgi:regulatory protein SWI5
MLSTNAPSGIQRRRTLHRRQNSTPAAFEAPRLQQLPTNIQQRRTQRTGMSLDLRGLNLEAMARPGTAATIPEYVTPDGTVSNTNLGQPPQHTMQVAHSHSQHQPGPQRPLLRSPVQTSLPSPRTPHPTLRPHSPQRSSHSPQRAPNSPTKALVDQRIKDLQEDVLAVYGPNANLFITLPTPNATPQKPAQPALQEQLETAALAPSFSDLADINFHPSSNAMAFNFENLDYDMGYESSSYYTSDALSPSPISSPNQKSMQAFLENIPEFPAEDDIAQLPPHGTVLSQAPMFSPSSASMSMHGLPAASQPPPALSSELEYDASLEYTGISPEEVQRYISEQDQITNKWTCLYPECGKVFGRRENIRSHVQTHLGDRQYKCNGCGKKFVRQHDLKRHAKIHTGNKPYKCPCGAGFARQDALTRHRQRGMCVGGFENVVRKNVKRGRPKKVRPDMDERAEKANKTRRALASASSSVSAGSPMSDLRSSPPPFEDMLQAQSSSMLLHETTSFHGPMSSTSDHYR